MRQQIVGLSVAVLVLVGFGRHANAAADRAGAINTSNFVAAWLLASDF